MQNNQIYNDIELIALEEPYANIDYDRFVAPIEVIPPIPRNFVNQSGIKLYKFHIVRILAIGAFVCGAIACTFYGLMVAFGYINYPPFTYTITSLAWLKLIVGISYSIVCYKKPDNLCADILLIIFCALYMSMLSVILYLSMSGILH
jgi:hypothetical protein